ncbi:MAG: glycine--tRNA ligase [Actinomycetota bacterium]|nr:glycine--tRNA ligase [Actinomycetota bacterium]
MPTPNETPRALTMQEMILALQAFWGGRGCAILQPSNTEVGAGTMNPATFLRVLGPEPWRAAYVEPSVRPDDSRYGENPNRLQTHTQFQVVLKPEPGDPQQLYLSSLEALGIDVKRHDVRFIEDNWAQPAIGAWGLGWEVWLDGMEITQFTYFQQVGGQNLDPVTVEITYGLERILMALQGVTHFRDLIYSDGLTYWEIWGQSEVEMSTYYLDSADVEVARQLYERYVAEADRLINERLPIPAHSFVLKSSHAFNVLDSRGAISTMERAAAFSTMRRLARSVGELWVERRAELGFPLGTLERSADAPEPPGYDDGLRQAPVSTGPERFVLEIGTEELPPSVVDDVAEHLASAVAALLKETRLGHGPISVESTPRRAIVSIETVEAKESPTTITVRGPRVQAAYGPDGSPTPALAGFARSRNVAVSDLRTVRVGDAEYVALEQADPGRSALTVLGECSERLVAGLHADRNMRWSDPELSFSRPIRWLLALYGATVVPVRVSGLRAGRTTEVLRTDDHPVREVPTAEALATIQREAGLLTDRGARIAAVRSATQALASGIGGTVDFTAESALLEEVANLLEAPFGVLGRFEERFLELPDPVLVTVMRKHQRYFPVRDDRGRLLPAFITMANGPCDDALVRAGNESVIRARYEDALFFWNADRRRSLEDFRAALDRLVFDARVGSMDQRARRIAEVAARLASVSAAPFDAVVLGRAGELAKFDLSTEMVVEFSSLAGVMAREYAREAGEVEAVAQALYEMELPQSSADALPSSIEGALLALADRADLIVAMFAIGVVPSGSSDPFGLRRAATGIARILTDGGRFGRLTISGVLAVAAERLAADGIATADETLEAAAAFVADRVERQLRDAAVDARLVAAVDLDDPVRALAVIAEVDALASDAAFVRAVQAMHRVASILPLGTKAIATPTALSEAAELDLWAEVEALGDASALGLRAWLDRSGGLVTAIEAFFAAVLVMVEDPDVRAARLGLLATVLEHAPRGVRWKALGGALELTGAAPDSGGAAGTVAPPT